MQKIAFRQFLLICAISLLPSTGCAAQQTWLGCQAADTMAAVTALGVTYRVSQNVVYSALKPGPHWSSNSDHLASCALYRGWLPSDIWHGWYSSRDRGWCSRPTEKGFAFADVVLRGLWPALAMGTLTAAAARSGSLPQLEMNDAIKPAVYAFGTLFAIGTGSALMRSNRGIVNDVVNSACGPRDKDNIFAWEQNLVDYGTYVGMACVPLYVYYQRYKV